MSAVIFDMDGVLVDSEPVYMRRFLQFMQAHQIALDDESYRKTVGWSSRMTWQWALSYWPEAISMTQLQELYRAYWKERPVRYDEVLDQDALPVLNQLRREGVRTALASSSPRSAIDQMLSQCGLTAYFDVIVSGEQFVKSKPDPEIYRYTASQLGLPCSRCLAVEDSTVGIAAAAAAGMYVLAKQDRRFGFDQSQAQQSIQRLCEILDVMKAKEIHV